MSAELVLERTYAAPVAKVFHAWTDKDAFAQWWGPKGWVMDVRKLDVVPGGIAHYSQNKNDITMWGRFEYLEIDTPMGLVFVNSFSNEAGEVVRAPFSETWPLKIKNTLTLTATPDGSTALRLVGTPLEPTPEETATFGGAIPMVQQGFKGTLDQLEAFLSKD